MKTEAQQQFHADMIRDVYRILKKHNVTTFLTNGSLLAIYKQGDLFRHAMGAVLSTFYAEIKPKEDKIIKSFQKAGFKISKHFVGENFKIRVKKKKFNVEIVGYTRGTLFYYRQLKNKKKIIPHEFFEKPYGKIKLRGMKYNTVRDIEGFLTFMYSDWRADIRKQSAPSKYKSTSHMVIER